MNPAAALENVRRRMAEACERSGRTRDSVSLVAISKTFPAERVREMVECGHDLFGENRVQEALAKIPEVGAGARWHLVGHLQRNKARHSVGVFELIRVSASLLNRKSQWLQPSANVWVLVRPQPRASLSAMSDMHTNGANSSAPSFFASSRFPQRR